MHAITEEILEKYQVRKTKAQKEAFRAFLVGRLAAEGIHARVEEKSTSVKSANIIVGEVAGAEVVFTAHYDTCAVLPIPNFLAPKNLPVSILYQLFLVLVILLVPFGLGVLAGWLGVDPALAGRASALLFYGMLLWMFFGPANKHTANDNTSGVAVLVESLLSLPKEARERAAFVFFDNEEMGLLGASFFRRMHAKEMANKPLINFDCVSDGDHILFVLGKAFRTDAALMRRTEAALSMPEGKAAELCPTTRALYPSDQMLFKKSAGVAALRRYPLIGLGLGRIHTWRDTQFDRANIEALRQFITSFLGA